MAAKQKHRSELQHEGERVELAVTILRSVEEVYSFWRDLNNHKRFGSQIEDAEVIAEVQNKRITWESVPGSKIQHMGTVEFKPVMGRRATQVSLQVRYHVRGDGRTTGFTKLLHNDLKRLQSLLETGKIPAHEEPPERDRKIKH